MIPRPGRVGGAKAMQWAITVAGIAIIACSQPEDVVPVAIDGHMDLVVEDGDANPMVIGKGNLSLCVAVEPADIRADWQLRIDVDGDEGSWLAPDRSVLDPDERKATICFLHEMAEVSLESTITLCGRLRKGTTAFSRSVDCVHVMQRPEDEALEAIAEAIDAAVGGDAILELAGRLDTLGYPMQALRLRLNGLHDLSRALAPDDFLPKARDVLGKVPGWLSDHERKAAYWMALVAFDRARLEFESGNLQAAWLEHGEAKRLLALVASPIWPLATYRRGQVLERLGAYDEARRLTEATLEMCDSLDACKEYRVFLEFQRAWLRTVDQNATEVELLGAIETFESTVRAEPNPGTALESAESNINIALAKQRLGLDPLPALTEARKLLAIGDDDPHRRSFLRDWSELIEAQESRPAEVASRSLTIAERAADSELVALAYDRAGWAAYRSGDLAAASRNYERALELFRLSSPTRLAHEVPLGTGGGARTVFRAAQVALERDDPESAWRLLVDLDEQSSFELRRRRCRAAARGEDAEAWRQLEREARERTDRMLSLGRPAPGAIRAQRLQQQEDERRQLLALSRQMPGCAAVERSARQGADGRAGRDLRAFALEEEIVALRWTDDDIVAYRAPVARRALRAIADSVEALLARGDAKDTEWRRLLEPVAEVLVPAVLDVGRPRVTVALHGFLQGIPLGALPLSDGRWLSDEVTTIIVPADVEVPASTRADRPGRAPLVVINPTGELQVRTPYRELVEDADILESVDATFEAVSNAVGGADWLHVDTHGYYDPAFADLSYLALADSHLGLGDVRAWDAELRFANLSGCETGRWPFTPDSGRYGIGGVFAAGRVDRVIASRSVIDNRIADRFNEHFYSALDQDVDSAYGQALAALRDEGSRAAEWAALMLIAGNGAGTE